MSVKCFSIVPIGQLRVPGFRNIYLLISLSFTSYQHRSYTALTGAWERGSNSRSSSVDLRLDTSSSRPGLFLCAAGCRSVRHTSACLWLAPQAVALWLMKCPQATLKELQELEEKLGSDCRHRRRFIVCPCVTRCYHIRILVMCINNY